MIVKTSARQNPSIRLHRDGKDNAARIRIEGVGRAGNGIESSNEITGLTSDAVWSGEISACYDFAVGFLRDGKNSAVRIRIKAIGEASRRIEPRNAITRLSANAVGSGKIAACYDPAILLNQERGHVTVRVRIERIGCPGFSIESRDEVARLTTNAVGSVE